MTMLEDMKEFEEPSTQKILEMLLVDRRQEFTELAKALGISTSIKGWEERVLKSCLFINDHLKLLMDTDNNESQDTKIILHSLTLMRRILWGV